MKRSIKITALLVGVAAAASIATGVAVATTTTTHPITLCVAKLGGNVSTPGSNGQCSKLQTAIRVASAADAAALAARMDAVEARQAADEAAIQRINDKITGRLTAGYEAGGSPALPFHATVAGSGLVPGSAVVLHYDLPGYPGYTGPTTIVAGSADANGNFNATPTTFMFDCADNATFYFTGTDIFGAVTSNTVVYHAANC